MNLVESQKKKRLNLKIWHQKQTITNRQPYAHFAEDKQRIAVLGGTSNETEILNDTTGNRRIIPINVLGFNMKKYKKINKVKLFIEMYHEWERIGDGWMLSMDDIKNLNENTNDFAEITMEEDLINKYFEPATKEQNYSTFLTTTDMVTICEQELGKQKIWIKKFGQVLRKLDFERKKSKGLYGFWVTRKN